MLNKAPRGTVDIYGEKMEVWQVIESKIRDITNKYRVKEIRTPMFEHTEIFVRATGESSDIVTKEMYTLYDKRGRSLTLKPEGTAGVARAFVENKMNTNELPQKLFYVTPCFRYEKPESGRQRQFHQLGMEYIGTPSVYADVEVIQFGYEFLKSLDIKNITLEINSLGDKECRSKFNDTLQKYLENKVELLCDECKERYIKNSMRVFDCKNETCQEELKDAPKITDELGVECSNDFKKLQDILSKLGIKYVVNKNLVRGLDYYTKTVFEFTTGYNGKNITICAGGRYNHLMKELAGVDLQAVGFGLGIERLVLLIDNEENRNKSDVVYIGSIGDEGKYKAIELGTKLRNEGIAVETDIANRNIKKQLKFADKIKAKFSIVIGENEVISNKVKLKNMDTGEEEEISLVDTEELIKKIKGE